MTVWFFNAGWTADAAASRLQARRRGSQSVQFAQWSGRTEIRPWESSGARRGLPLWSVRCLENAFSRFLRGRRKITSGFVKDGYACGEASNPSR